MNAIYFDDVINDDSVQIVRIIECYVCELMQQIKMACNSDDLVSFTSLSPYEILRKHREEIVSSSDQHLEYEWKIYEGNILIKINVVEKYKPVDPHMYCEEGEVWKEGEVSILFESYYKHSSKSYRKCNRNTIMTYHPSSDELMAFDKIESHIRFICDELHAEFDYLNSQRDNIIKQYEQDAQEEEEERKKWDEEEERRKWEEEEEERRKWEEEERLWEAKMDRAVSKAAGF
jgi:hypothetical protein